MPTETEITRKLVKAIRDIHGKQSVLNLHGNAMQMPGWPDLLIITPGVRAWVECKGPTTELRNVQKVVLAYLKKCNEPVFLLRFMTNQIYILEDTNEHSLYTLGGATYKDAARSLIGALAKLAGEYGATNGT